MRICVVGLRGAGTVCHMGGRVDFTLCSRVRHWDRLWSSAVKGEGDFGGVVLLSPRPVGTALKPVRACATVVSSRYSAWRAPAALWFDESLITLCQRARLQRRRTSFFIILVLMNGPPTRE